MARKYASHDFLNTDILPLSKKELNELHAGLGQELAAIIDQSLPNEPFTHEQESSLRALKKKREAVELRTRMKFKQEEAAYERSIKPYQEMVDLAFDCIANRLGLQDIDKTKYGVWFKLDETLPVRGKYSVNNDMTGYLITLRPDADMTTVAEEVGHHFRNLFMPVPNRAPHNTKEEYAFSATHEFFGYLGRKLVYESLNEKQQKHFFPEGPPKYDFSSRNREVLALNKQAKNKSSLQERLLASKSYRQLKEEFTNWRQHQSDPEAQKKLEEAKKEVVAVYNILKRDKDTKKEEATIHTVHHIGYKYGNQVDPHKLDSSGLYSLYSLENQEVKRHFFKERPDYDFVEGYNPPPHTFDPKRGKNLEDKVLATFAIASIAGSLFFISSNLTGNTIVHLSQANNSIIGGVLFLIGIIAALFYFRKK